jgi:hypothetical protein
MLDGITPCQPWQPLSRVCHTDSPFIFFPLRGWEIIKGLAAPHAWQHHCFGEIPPR